MPELPEVETVCRQLHARIAGEKILKTVIYDDKLAGFGNVKDRIVVTVRRSGKTIIILLNDETCLKIHLRMTGRLLWREDKKKEPHTRLRLVLAKGCVDLVDPRRFATVTLDRLKPTEAGKDLMLDFDEEAFLASQAVRNVNVKVLLMDPKAIAGIGNIYACEILHRSGISPLRQAATLSEKEWKKLFRSGRRILEKGIKKRGTSISDWRDLYGCPGENQHELKVYGQEGRSCCSCGGTIIRIKQGGRSTFYCPQCQT